MPGPGHSPTATRIQIGDLVGLPGKSAEGKSAQLAVVSGLQGSRADVHLGDPAKSITLPVRQLELLVSNPEPGVVPQTLRHPPWNLTPEALAQSTPRRRDLAAAWQVLLTDTPAGKEPTALSLSAFSELVSGRSDPVHCCACWLWLQGSQSLFRFKQGLIQPRQLEDLRRLRQERHRLQLAETQQSSWLHALKHRQPIDLARLGPKQAGELAELRLWASGQRDLLLSDDLKHLLQQLRCSSEPAQVRHLLVDVGQWPRHHLPSLQGTSWQQGFSEALLAEAAQLLSRADEPWPGDSQRLDLSHLQTVTIDDDDTADIDDGLSVEWVADGTPRVWIHVADPGRLVAPGSPLDLEARRRGTSLYLAQGTLPMFPEALATGPFSLRSGQRCAAWSLRIQLAEDGALAEMDLHRSWVRPAYRLSYGDADELLELAPPQERALLTLQRLMQTRRSWRAKRGALFLDQAEGRIRCRPQGQENPSQEEALLEIIEPSPSRLMVAEAMILAGAAIADYGHRHHLALPYRSQPVAPVPTAQELEAVPPGPARLAAIKKCLTRGVVGTSALPHFSLGLEAYVQATSPIRRYGDLLVQRQLAAHLEGQIPLETLALTDLLSTVEGGLREGMAISREDQRHWQQVWFAQERGQQWRGVFLRWLREDHHLALVHLESVAMDLPAECHGVAQPGDGVLVRVRDVDPLRDLLRLDARCL
ncbi:MAG: ribonuclease catalytic domain-containing protein [Cyanobacteriota bacterium]|nr:ribonuclease catalytic domain-containing protein [Cyanobacteriota bacterium]